MVSALGGVFVVSRFCTSLSYRFKILNSTFARVFAFIILYISFEISDLFTGFWVSLIASLFLGAFTIIDHVVFVSYLKDFPAYCFSSYLSGQGFSGLFSTLIYLGIKQIEFPFKYICIVMIPANLIIIFIFWWMECLKANYLQNTANNLNLETELENSKSLDFRGQKLIENKPLLETKIV